MEKWIPSPNLIFHGSVISTNQSHLMLKIHIKILNLTNVPIITLSLLLHIIHLTKSKLANTSIREGKWLITELQPSMIQI